MRRILIGSYDTAASGRWTLGPWELSEAEPKTSQVEVPGSDIVLDLSTTLTDGEPRFGTRTFTATLESSEGDRLERKARIDAMINELHGWRKNIMLPDDGRHYLTGLIRVKELYNDLAHCSVQVTAVCDPWKYAVKETEYNLTATETEQTATLVNAGRRSVVPVLTDTGGSVTLAFGPWSWSLSAGSYQLPDLYLTTGRHDIKYSGSGAVLIKYREAVL